MLVRWNIVAGFAAALFVVLALATEHTTYGSSVLLRDPAASVGYAPQIGALSHLGVVLWAMVATLLGFAALVADHATVATRRGSAALAMLVGGLGVDDLFLFHEDLLPDATGLSETAVFAGYGVVGCALAWVARPVLAIEEHRPMLVFAVAALGTSIATDVLGLTTSVAFEDGTKLVGIFALMLWAGDVARTLVRPTSADTVEP